MVAPISNVSSINRISENVSRAHATSDASAELLTSLDENDGYLPSAMANGKPSLEWQKKRVFGVRLEELLFIIADAHQGQSVRAAI